MYIPSHAEHVLAYTDSRLFTLFNSDFFPLQYFSEIEISLKEQIVVVLSRQIRRSLQRRIQKDCSELVEGNSDCKGVDFSYILLNWLRKTGDFKADSLLLIFQRHKFKMIDRLSQILLRKDGSEDFSLSFRNSEILYLTFAQLAENIFNVPAICQLN